MIYETKTKGKIYNAFNDNLIFEGEFLNNKKYGKGKEYYDNADKTIKFEGEYKNGKKNGKGKEYNYNGDLTYEGIYFDNKKNGKGTEYYVGGEIKCIYEYKIEKIWNMKEYSKNNNYKIINEINEGKGIINGYNSKGEIITQIEITNGEINGKKRQYYDNGKLKSEG